MKTMLTQLAPLASFLITEGIEGFRTEAYDDATGETLGDDDEAIGVVTIGAGATRWEDGTLIAPGSSITYQEGQDLLLGYLRTELVPAFARLIKVPLNETQAAAFGSFLYNFGETKAKGYTLTKLINKRADNEVIARQWMKYVYSGGKKALGLYRRRMAEVLLWFGLDWRAALNVDWDDDVMDVAMRLGYDPEGNVEDDLLDEPTAMEIAQHESAKAVGYDGTIEEFTEHLRARPGKTRISQMTRKIEDVPYGVDRDAGAKPMDEAGRFKEAARAKSARDDQDVGRAATAAAAGLGVANTIVNETTTLLDSVTGYAIMFLVLLFVFGAAWWGYGRWREYDAEKKRLEAEINARQVMY